MDGACLWNLLGLGGLHGIWLIPTCWQWIHVFFMVFEKIQSCSLHKKLCLLMYDVFKLKPDFLCVCVNPKVWNSCFSLSSSSFCILCSFFLCVEYDIICPLRMAFWRVIQFKKGCPLSWKEVVETFVRFKVLDCLLLGGDGSVSCTRSKLTGLWSEIITGWISELLSILE